MFNKAMLDVMCEHDFKTIGFDSLLYYVGILNHNIFFDDDPYIYYRQHGDNVSGVKRRGLDYIWHKINDVLLNQKGLRQPLKYNARYILNNFKWLLSEGDEELVSIVGNYNSFFDKLKLIRNTDIRAGYWPKDFFRTIRILLGRY